MKQVVEEMQEVCSLCVGRGKEDRYDLPQTTAWCQTATCRRCGGTGHIVTRRVVRSEQEGR